tara:strand:+ start:169 stop:393 length:225 start_codon:yes stop_codon:yes gene_type:complete
MLDIHEKPIHDDHFVDVPTNELEYYTDDEIRDFFFPEDDQSEEADMYADGYPDELIPEHAFTSDEEDYYDDYAG